MMAQDTRTVTEPSIPPVCQELTATFTQTYNVPVAGNTLAGPDGLDVSPSVDSTVTNPDGARINAALVACANTGNAVELSMDSTGAYNAFISGPIVMQPGETLLVDPGVTLFFSRNARDYNANPSANTNSCGTYGGAGSCNPLISMQSNDSIMGYGKINGRGGDVVINGYQAANMTNGKPTYPAPSTITWWSLAKQADITGGSQVNPLMIVPKSGSSNVTLYKITLMNSPEFHVKGAGVINGFTAWDMKIVTPTWGRNTDGIDPQPVNNGTIINSWISDGDDNVALGASGAPGPKVTAQNISVLNNHFYAGHGQSIGSFTDGTVQNAVWSGNMAAGNGYSGKGSAINQYPYTVQTNPPTVYPVNFADSVGPSTGIRIKSDQAAGGIVQNITYENECLLDHLEVIQFTPLYNTDSGSDTPNVSGITFKNLAFLNDANSFGTVQFTGTHTVVSGKTITNPLGLTLSNVSFPSTLKLSDFVTTGTKGTEQYANLTYGPGDVSNNFISDWATFVATPADNDTATNNITVNSLNPPVCNFTYIAPELTGPKNVPQTINLGQTATAVVILTPVVGGAAWPTGTVTLTDELTSKTTEVTLPGTTDTIFVPLTGLGVGVHSFTAAYSGDTTYVATPGQPYSTAGPYEITVLEPPTPVITTTAALSGSASTGYTATITVTNSGTGPASNVTLNSATLGSATGSPLPQDIGSIAAGHSSTFTVSFPGSAGLNGAGVAEKYAGTYTGGSFSASVRSVALP